MDKALIKNFDCIKVIFIAGILIQAGILASSLHIGPVWDEHIFRNNCFLFDKYGLSRQFLINIRVQAPGPLYQMVHFLFKAVTGYDIFLMRVVNFMLLAPCLWFLHRAIATMSREVRLSYGAFFFLAVPGVFATGVLAMSETPTLLFASLFLFLFSKIVCLGRSAGPRKLLLLSAGAGIALGLTIIGRSPMLVIVFALLCAVVVGWKSRHPAVSGEVGGIKAHSFSFHGMIVQVAIIIVLSSIVYLPVFLAWGGLVPPDIAILDADMGSLNYMNYVIGLIQCGILLLIICPKLLWTDKKICWITVLLFFIMLAINILAFKESRVSVTIEKALFLSKFPQAFKMIFRLALPCIYIALSAYVMFNMAYAAVIHRRDTMIVVCIVSILLILGSQIKMANYSVGTRHISQIAPFIVVLLPAFGSEKLLFIRYFSGLALGVLLSLHHFYHTPSILM